MGKNDKPAAKQKKRRIRIIRLPFWFDEEAEQHRRRIEEDKKHGKQR